MPAQVKTYFILSDLHVIKIINFLIVMYIDIAVDIHVTPYQVKDSGRPWIGKEEKQFYSTLKKAGVVLSRKLHFEEETASIENHFLLLKHFE